MRHVRPIFIALIALAALSWQSQPAQATHTVSGGSPLAHIDQISIDLGPAGTNVGVEGNGKPAVGDRDGDGVVDAEGAPDPGGNPMGVCNNGLDDDSGGPFAVPPDGVADDGCQVTLTPRETCAEIIDDGLLNADEDFIDTLSVDVTVGVQPGVSPGVPGGVPPFNGINGTTSAWGYTLNWVPELLRVNAPRQVHFLIHTDGAASPFIDISATLPDLASPWTAGVADGGFTDDGSGVLNRIRIEGDVAGLANLTLSDEFFSDRNGPPIPVDLLNGAQTAVSKDGPDSGTAIGDSPGEQYDCDQDNDGVYDPNDNCPGVYNPTQGDLDSDGLGDDCDPDADVDGDGVPNGTDACPQVPGVPARMGCPEPAVGGITGLLDRTEPASASLTSDDERGRPALALALSGGAAAIIAASLVAVLRRRR